MFADELGSKPEGPNGDKQIDFTGRDLLTASLYEKCFHDYLSKLIESLESDDYELEKMFLSSMALRIEKCDAEVA